VDDSERLKIYRSRPDKNVTKNRKSLNRSSILLRNKESAVASIWVPLVEMNRKRVGNHRVTQP